MLEHLSDETKHPIIHVFTQEVSDSYAKLPSLSRAMVLGTAAVLDAVRVSKPEIETISSNDEVD